MLALTNFASLLALDALPAWLYNLFLFLKVLIGFSIIIFVHELGHFLAAKWVGVRVDRFAVGFGPRLFGYRHREGLTFGNRPAYTADELRQKRYGETDYCFKALPLGGYVKMLGQDDIVIDEKSGEVKFSDDPRAFTNRPVGQRMIVVSAGVVFNLLFAALALMLVFLIGKQMPAAVVGVVPADSPAYGIIQPGDRLVSINGRQIDWWMDVTTYTAFSQGPVSVVVERDGKVLTLREIEPERDERQNVRTLRIAPAFSTRALQDGFPVGDAPNVLAGDVITHVNGTEVRENGVRVAELFRESRGEPRAVRVVRSDPKNSAATPQAIETVQRAQLILEHAEPPLRGRPGTNHILGMFRRLAVSHVQPGYPAARATPLDGGERGFKAGDVLLEWGSIANPTYDEVINHIRANGGRETTVRVERAGRELRYSVTPRSGFSLFGPSEPRVGLGFELGEENRAVVAAVAPETPAAELNLPRGAEITAIDGEPVGDWFAVTQKLLGAGGRAVRLTYRTGGDEVTAELQVPPSLYSALGIPPTSLIWKIDDRREVELTLPDDSKRRVTLPQVYAVRGLLAQSVGKEVEVEFSPGPSAPRQKALLAVTKENIDPWPARINYEYIAAMSFEVLQTKVHANGNPIEAMWMGTKLVGNMVSQIYQFLGNLGSRNVGVQSVAGPIGIAAVAMEQARVGWDQLVFFMALLSVNLAVINFLPLPVMDGGLMVFLLIEKIKGKPLGLKTQMVTSLVGLAAIVLIFVLVTVQDISRLLSG